MLLCCYAAAVAAAIAALVVVAVLLFVSVLALVEFQESAVRPSRHLIRLESRRRAVLSAAS